MPNRVHADIRLQGFADRIPVAQAMQWVDGIAPSAAAEEIELAAAAGRVPAVPIAAAEDIPPSDRAAIDGYAMRAAETVGAGDYNPLPIA
ncbi:MAG: molybdopterin biosynthesis protein, partial [Alphaproteobacteria bacterium]|nr:molybdopterin biosynthesis protein [Alphaproteobacteria bacterium]